MTLARASIWPHGATGLSDNTRTYLGSRALTRAHSRLPSGAGCFARRAAAGASAHRRHTDEPEVLEGHIAVSLTLSGIYCKQFGSAEQAVPATAVASLVDGLSAGVIGEMECANAVALRRCSCGSVARVCHPRAL